VSLFVTDFYNGKLSGVIAASYRNDILIYDIEGKLQKYFKNAHDNTIIALKLVKNVDDNKSVLLISTSRDG
jgi:hypothetical protein